jgi:maltose alpha-D-glucosyltransferase/alpha-amylase
MTDPIARMRKHWKELYGSQQPKLLDTFISEIRNQKHSLKIKPDSAIPPLQPEWYKDAIVYSLYVDLFNHDLPGLEGKLDYLAELGVNCLWLLPILESPMRDAGFDISDYQRIRHSLLNLPKGFSMEEQDRVFTRFLEQARQRGIKVIFDIAINHTSDQHPWFKGSRQGKDNPYRDYYIWAADENKFTEARVIFEGIETSNWKKDGEEYFFHRFFDFQPDLNYRNPMVLVEMAKNMLFWLQRGVDGFRADAIPYLWKEEGTNCENLPKTHTIVKFFRAVLDFFRPNTLLLAEACQKPHEVVKYFGRGDECHAGYHFPLMPQIFKAMAMQSGEPVANILSLEVTPEIPQGSQWFTFLRCHDELSLELVYVSEEDRKYIHDKYCKMPDWDFRLGQGISARLSELMDRDPKKIALIYSIMLTLPGTPVIYYGDEFGKLNDDGYYEQMKNIVGKDDSRFLVRGRIDWEKLEEELNNSHSFSNKVYTALSRQIEVRQQNLAFGRGDLEWLEISDERGNKFQQVLAYIRSYGRQQILILHNLSEKPVTFILPDGMAMEQDYDLLGKEIDLLERIFRLKPLDYQWISLD